MLPQKLSLDMMQVQWASQIDPLIANPLTKGNLLKNIALTSGANVVSHKLGRKLQGWIITRIRAAQTVYDTQDSNQIPELTLNLVASGDVTVDLLVF